MQDADQEVSSAGYAACKVGDEVSGISSLTIAMMTMRAMRKPSFVLQTELVEASGAFLFCFALLCFFCWKSMASGFGKALRVLS